VPSIVNGLFSGRSGISSHGAAIAVIGDNISNASTIGYKSSRAEFEDLIAGGQTAGKVIGSGSATSGVSTIFEQGTLEFTSRPLDLAIDGNGFFTVRNGLSNFYTRAGNFKVDSQGYIIDQNGFKVLGFQAGGSGALDSVNVNQISQSSVASTEATVQGNLDAGDPIIAVGSIPSTLADGVANAALPATTYADLNAASSFSTVMDVFDTLGAKHTLTFFFTHTAAGQYTVKGYANSDDVDTGTPATGKPRLIGTATLTFGSDGSRTNVPAGGSFDIAHAVKWNNGSDQTNSLGILFDQFTSYSTSSNIASISQNGQGVGTVTSVSIEKDGQIFALLSNGQSATIGTIGLTNFSNPEGLTRIGNNLLQQSASSGEPIVGRPESGTFGSISAGSLELSTVDIANEFVKLITIQRGFQANSRIITTINQLLNDIIQLA